jgi:PAS domain S-box-containing protein
MARHADTEAPPPIRVLYIDDDPDLLELTETFLESRTDRIDVETTTSARDALDLLDREAFDAVVCDYQMPEMDGVTVLETLREDRGDETPFIIFTGRGREEVAIEALNLGADRYLRKGGDPTSQYEVLARAIEQEVDHDRTQRRLRRREEDLRITLESIGDAVVVADVDAEITRLNAVAEELTGWDAEAAVGRPLSEVFEILNQETREPEPDPARTVLETGRTVGLANGTILVRKDGSERLIADSASPIENADGEVVGVVIVFRDVTEQYRTRNRQRRQRETTIELALDDDITDGDFEAGKRRITAAAARTLDVDRVGLWLFEDGDSVLRNVDLYDAAADTHEQGATLTAEEYPDYFDALETHRAIDAADARTDPRTAGLAEGYLEPLGITSVLDATVRTGGECIGVLRHEHTGEPREWTEDELRFVGEVADQVRRLVHNRRRREHEDALKQLHAIATDITTFDGREAICRRTIEVAEAILDFENCVINLEEDGMLPIAAISENMPADGATPMSVEEGLVGATYRTGESFLLEDARESAVANPQGPYRGALSIPVGDHGVFQTVSDRIGAFDEDDLELAELLVSHTAQALDQLASERELRERNERLDEFARVVSHDLRNPLNVAEGRLELAREECDSDHLDDVARAHDRMADLIGDLLSLAREEGASIDIEPVDLGAVARSCWRNVDTADATLVVDADRRIRADEGRLRQLLENLVHNAVEHGAPDVTVTVGELDGGFSVADDGPGVPTDERDDVFGMGYSTSDDGTGFGLAIVKRIAESHGWSVAVADGADGGARFEITGVDSPEA